MLIVMMGTSILVYFMGLMFFCLKRKHLLLIVVVLDLYFVCIFWSFWLWIFFVYFFNYKSLWVIFFYSLCNCSNLHFYIS